MKRVIQGLEKENSVSFLLASLSSTPARIWEMLPPGQQNAEQSLSIQ